MKHHIPLLTLFIFIIFPSTTLHAGIANSTKNGVNYFLLLALMTALITFLSQIVISIIEINQQSNKLIQFKRLTSGANLIFGIIFTAYLLLFKNGQSSPDSLVVTVFFGVGLMLFGAFGLKKSLATKLND